MNALRQLFAEKIKLDDELKRAQFVPLLAFWNPARYGRFL
jgi:hypothetical protein